MAIKTEKPILIADCEVGPAHFTLGWREIAGQKRTRVRELSPRTPTIDWEKIDKVLRSHTVVGYNWHGFDAPLLAWAIERPDCTTEQLKEVADRIIRDKVRPWNIADVPEAWDYIDLMEPQPNAFASLKALNGRMHGRWMQELPYPHDKRLTEEELDHTIEYMINDLDGTEALYHRLAEPLALREYLGEIYGTDFRSKSDPQVGEAMMKIGVERRTHRRVYKPNIDDSKSFRYPVPEWAVFETPAFRQLADDIRATDFWLDNNLKVIKPKSLDGRLVTLDGTEYSIGIGGIHSTESNRATVADDEFTLIDADVGSQYPAAILSLGLCPESMGQPFQDEYRSLRDTRMEAKRNKDKVKDKGFKISLNGVYGKLGSPYSVVFAPHLMIGVTISCQLSILLLVERLVAAGFGIVSANTDGILIRCHRSKFSGITKDRLNACDLSEITDRWEADTGFSLEFGEFSAIYNLSVNSYFAIKANGGHKRKGAIPGNPWNEHPDDYDPLRGQLMKNPAATICSDAVLALLKDGTPVEETIRGCTDIRQFVTVVAASAGATWRGGYLGKVVRYYWGVDGDPILEAKPNAGGNYKQVPKTEGARPCMTLPDELPGDIDYARYVTEARDILKDIGYFGAPPRRPKFGRLNPMKQEALFWMGLAA